jgi:hypothetical protein
MVCRQRRKINNDILFRDILVLFFANLLVGILLDQQSAEKHLSFDPVGAVLCVWGTPICLYLVGFEIGRAHV